MWRDITGVTAQRDAANAQRDANTQAQNAMREQLDPYAQAGQNAMQAQQNLLGLGGAQAQQAAIEGISGSPMFQSLVAQGEDALLQNAAATGGIRGGNTAAALAQFAPQMLNQQIQQQMAHLGGLAGMGMNASSQLASGLSGLAGQRGDINASQHLGEYNAQRGFVTDAVGLGLQIAGIPGFGFGGGGGSGAKGPVGKGF